jgi:DNA polymerase I
MTIRLLITNTEQIQPQAEDGTVVVLYGRNPDHPEKRYEVKARGFRPYFYAREEECRDNESFLLGQESIQEIEYGNFDAFNTHENLAKVYPPYPQDTRSAREYFDQTWNADVPFTNRFRIDTGLEDVVEVPEPDEGQHVVDCHWREITPVEDDFSTLTPRVMTLDIEVDDRGDGFPQLGDERILSIVAKDSYTDEVVGFIDLNGRAIEEAFPNGAPDNIDTIHVQDSERKMLIDFRVWFNEQDPDLVTGWNSDDFDIPFILKRMRNLNGVNPNVLSPLGWAGVTSRGEPRIKGRTCYDLLEVYKANSFTELRSYKLDDVAAAELGAEKIQFEGSYYELYDRNPEKFMEYNAHDVHLTADINDEAGVIKFRDTLRREVGVDFEDSYNASDFIEMMCRRRLYEQNLVGPTAQYDGHDDYDGAYVFDAYKGVAKNVVGIDLASLYPYTMAMLNASPETKGGSPENAAHAENDVYFSLEEDGLFKELVDDAIGLKQEYKEKREAAETDEEYEKWEQKYLSAKTITNSIYGVTGWERFFLYDEDVAAAVTLTGQKVIKRTAEYVEGQGHDVIYGDTDSTYIKLDESWDRDKCLDIAHALCDTLNISVYPELAESIGIPPEDNLWEIEVEAYMERFFQAGKKKRYAYLATWKDGREVDNPKPTIKGFSSRRSDSAELTVETEEAILNAILHGEEEKVSDIVFEAAQEITADDPDWERIGIPGGMNNKINRAKAGQDGYYAFSAEGFPQDAHPRAVWNANKILGTDITSGDKPKRVYVKQKVFDEVGRPIDVIAFEESRDLEPAAERLEVDTGRMTEVLLLRPLRRILNAVGVDADAAVRGQEQTGLGAFK